LHLFIFIQVDIPIFFHDLATETIFIKTDWTKLCLLFGS